MNVDAGFTLLELLLVVTLLAIGAALVPPSVRRLEPEPRETASDSVAAIVTSTRAMAIRERRSMTLVLSPSNGVWWRIRGYDPVDSGRWSPEQGRILGSDDRLSLAFTPSGSVWTSAPIRFLERGDTTTLTIDPWTGRVRLE